MNEREKERKKEIQKEDDYSGFSQTHTCLNMQLEFAVFVLTVVPHLLEFLIKFSAMIYLFTIVKVIQKTYKWPNTYMLKYAIGVCSFCIDSCATFVRIFN